MPDVRRQPAGVIHINDSPYFLARDARGAPTWLPQQIPTQEGDPTRPGRWRWNDWSRGLGDSRGIYRGAVEYAVNAYLPMGRMLPGPAIAEITAGHSATVQDIIEVTVPANRVISFGGTTAKEINPADHTVAATGTLTGSALSAQLYGEEVAIAVGDTVDYYVRDNLGAYAQNSISKKARCFGLSGPDLVRGYLNTWSKCSAANITSVNNWGTEYALGDKSGLVNQVFSHNRWDYALKDEGLYTFNDDTSEEANLLTDLISFKSSENRWVFRWADYVFVCTYAGLYRYIQRGAARTVGPEELEFNESVLSDVFPTAGVAFGKWGYVAFWDGTNTYICLVKRYREGDATPAPFTIVSVIDTFAARCNAMIQTGLSGAPEVYYGAGTNVRYFTVTRDGLPASYRSSGSVTVDLSPTDLGSPLTLKYMRGLEVIGRNITAARNIQFAANLDGAGFNNVGSALTSLSSSFGTAFWTLGANDVGRVVQLRATLGLNSASVPPEIREIALNYEERPIMVPGAIVGILARDHYSEAGIVDERTAYEVRSDLENLLDGTPVAMTDPWGDTFTVALQRYEGEPRWQYTGETPKHDLAFAVRSLDYA